MPSDYHMFKLITPLTPSHAPLTPSTLWPSTLSFEIHHTCLQHTSRSSSSVISTDYNSKCRSPVFEASDSDLAREEMLQRQTLHKSFSWVVIWIPPSKFHASICACLWVEVYVWSLSYGSESEIAEWWSQGVELRRRNAGWDVWSHELVHY